MHCALSICLLSKTELSMLVFVKSADGFTDAVCNVTEADKRSTLHKLGLLTLASKTPLMDDHA